LLMAAAYSSPRRSGAAIASPAALAIFASDVHSCLDLGLRQWGRALFGRLATVARVWLVGIAIFLAIIDGTLALPAIVRREADRRVHFELHRRQKLLHFTGEVGVLQEIANLFGDDAEEPILRLVDLGEQIVGNVLRDLHVSDELLQVVRS